MRNVMKDKKEREMKGLWRKRLIDEEMRMGLIEGEGEEIDKDDYEKEKEEYV